MNIVIDNGENNQCYVKKRALPFEVFVNPQTLFWVKIDRNITKTDEIKRTCFRI